MNLGLEGDCSIDSKGGPQKERPQRPYKILGMSAKFGSLQGGRRVQCSSDRNDDIVLSEVASMASAAVVTAASAATAASVATSAEKTKQKLCKNSFTNNFAIQQRLQHLSPVHPKSLTVQGNLLMGIDYKTVRR